ncbi:hypothetical protein CDAR_302281 [Caerostris darwini]|uniref:Uncharacterized protein n=1 Tax=Caerostris darwini TaxID=1538125 RepID=A0AAV4VP55_9ARAC|nr:hypothetical protein CDAR_302281 [Caerostris darwini]
MAKKFAISPIELAMRSQSTWQRLRLLKLRSTNPIKNAKIISDSRSVLVALDNPSNKSHHIKHLKSIIQKSIILGCLGRIPLVCWVGVAAATLIICFVCWTIYPSNYQYQQKDAANALLCKVISNVIMF